jgi:hypothetical protein
MEHVRRCLCAQCKAKRKREADELAATRVTLEYDYIHGWYVLYYGRMHKPKEIGEIGLMGAKKLLHKLTKHGE